MADKGDTYYCAWRCESNGVCIGWEIRRPTLRAQASSPRELQGALGRIVGEYYDDHEAALHFNPSLTAAGDPAWFVDGIIGIAWNAQFKFRPTASTAYANGRCERCGLGLGPRTGIALEVDEIKSATDGASSPGSNEPPPNRGMPGALMIVSQAFLDSLTGAERATFEARPVISATNAAAGFFELVPHTQVPVGVIKGLEVTGWRCDRCGRRHYSNARVIGTGVKVVCRENIPASSPAFFFAGSGIDVNLFCTLDRWREFAGKNWARKLTGQRLAVVTPGEFETNPLLGTLDEMADFRRVHGSRTRFRPKPGN